MMLAALHLRTCVRVHVLVCVFQVCSQNRTCEKTFDVWIFISEFVTWSSGMFQETLWRHLIKKKIYRTKFQPTFVKICCSKLFVVWICIFLLLNMYFTVKIRNFFVFFMAEKHKHFIWSGKKNQWDSWLQYSNHDGSTSMPDSGEVFFIFCMFSSVLLFDSTFYLILPADFLRSSLQSVKTPEKVKQELHQHESFKLTGWIHRLTLISGLSSG